MSTKPRTSEMSQQLSTPNFKPKSEWKQEGETSFLIVYLPGYAVEKLTITPEYSNGKVKIEGNRRLPSNKLMPVDETFDIPQHCDLSKMDKQFGLGILTLKFPTSIVVSQEQASKQTMEEETVAENSMTDHPPKQTSTTNASNEQSPEKSAMEEQISVRRADKTDDEEKLVDGANGREANVIDEKISEVTDAESDEEKLVDDVTGRADAKPEEGPESESLVQNKGGMKVDEESKGKSSKESSAAAMDSATNASKFKEKRKRKSRNWGNSSKGKVQAKEGNENKKLVLNMGLAILVLIAITLLYTLGVFMVGLSFQVR